MCSHPNHQPSSSLALTHRRAASPATSCNPGRPGHRVQHRPMPSLATGSFPFATPSLATGCFPCHAAASAAVAVATVTAHATTTSRPGARERLYGILPSASHASAHTYSLYTHEHTHTFLPHRILLRPTRGAAQSARGGEGGGEAAQPNTAHGATGPEYTSARDEAEAQASLLNLELAHEPTRVDGPD
jgi:hypothetical protein